MSMAQQQPVVRQRAAWWQSAILAVVGVLVFVGIVIGLDAAFQPQLTGTSLIIVGIILAIVPAILWLVFFYLQDHLEPEPKREVFKIFIVGLALASAIGIPLTDQVFRVEDWLYRSSTSLVLGSIFIIGAIEAFIIYLTVRHFIYDSDEFNERTDGMVYGTAAGLGYATALNVQFILGSGGAALGGAEVFIAEVALAHAAFAGVLGYFLGRAKLEREKIWWLPIGLLLATLLNGLFIIVRSRLESGSIVVGAASALPSVTGLILAGALALVVAGIVAALIRRDISHTETRGRRAEVDAHIGDMQSNRATVGMFAVLIIVGIIASAVVTGGMTSFDVSGFKGEYPAHFGLATREGEVLRVADTLGSGAEFAIQTLDLEPARTPTGCLTTDGDAGN
jgi:RsiW-degrading membrane proteinase PrsW (M82 family)